MTFIGIRKRDITDVWLGADLVEITVRFVIELVAATRVADNTVIGGDPKKIVTVTDLWTFARRIPSSNPNWEGSRHRRRPDWVGFSILETDNWLELYIRSLCCRARGNEFRRLAIPFGYLRVLLPRLHFNSAVFLHVHHQKN